VPSRRFTASQSSGDIIFAAAPVLPGWPESLVGLYLLNESAASLKRNESRARRAARSGRVSVKKETPFALSFDPARKHTRPHILARVVEFLEQDVMRCLSMRVSHDSAASVAPNSKRSTLRITCPSRFEQDGTIYPLDRRGSALDPEAKPTGETPFLQRVPLMRPQTPL
jgi:hypothetical protein